jgi:hypothetical protein
VIVKARKMFLASVCAAAMLLALSGCFQRSNDFGGLGHQEQSDLPVPTTTYQQDIAAAISARPTVGASIAVAAYPSLEDAARAWSDAYIACIRSGNAPMQEANIDAYIMDHNGIDDLYSAIPIDLHLSDNWSLCTSTLMSSTPAAVDVNAAFAKYNTVLVDNLFVGNTVRLDNPAFTVLSFGNQSLAFRTTYTEVVKDESSDSFVAGFLTAQPDGLLTYTGPLH